MFRSRGTRESGVQAFNTPSTLTTALIVLITFACRRDRTTVCTAIGCVNDLTVEIQSAPPGPITIQALPVGTPDTVHTASCTGEARCSVRFGGFAPVHVHLTITTTAGIRQWDVRPSFSTSQPNGPGCPEICRYGTVRLAWQ